MQRKLFFLRDSLLIRALAVLVLTAVVGVYCWSLTALGDYGQKPGSEPPITAKVMSGGHGGMQVMGFYCEDYPGDGSSQESLERNGGDLDWVSPFWYSIDSKGKVNNRGSEKGMVINQAKLKGVKVLGLFNNQRGTDLFLLQPSIRTAAVEEVVKAVEDDGLDGVNIDFEGLEPASREGLTEFMAELYYRLHQRGKAVTVSVLPKWSEDERSCEWSYAYDYQHLAEVADYLVIMAYDQHGVWSGPGPVADPSWVSSALEFALRRVPAEQLLLGIAGYGYDWGGGDAQSVPARDALALAQRWGAEVVRDGASGTQRFVYYKEGTRHQVWWEDAESVLDKVNLARTHRLAGIALWRLGQEEQQFWPCIATQ